MVDIDYSLDLDKNVDKILEFNRGPSGGKSGEFFFFTHDKKIILKTMSSNELLAL